MKKFITLLCIIGSFAIFAQSQPFNPNGDKMPQMEMDHCEAKLNNLLVYVRHNTTTMTLIDASDETKEKMKANEWEHAEEFLSECSL